MDATPQSLNKTYVEEEDLLNDAYRLAVKVYESGFRPDFIVGIWRGGSTVGIYVQECLQYLGVKTDHIAIRTSYRGMESYLFELEHPESIRVHGLQYLYEAMNRDDSLLIVDDVFSSGQNVEAVIQRLESAGFEGTVVFDGKRPRVTKTAGVEVRYETDADRWIVENATITSSIPMSMCWPSPVMAWWRSAALIETPAYMPAIRSATGIADFIGSPSGSPVTLMKPLMPWIRRS